MKKFFYLSLLAILSILASCGGHTQKDPDYFPFKESEKDDWGMVSTDGEVLFSDEFKNMPTCVYRDRFFVKNKSDNWEMYTADAKPKKISGEYEMASVFMEDVVPVRRAGKKYIEFIDVDGKTKFTLKKVGKQKVNAVSNFYRDGLAIFLTEDDRYGFINTSGEVVVQPDYCECKSWGNYIILVHKKYEGKEKQKATVLNGKGETVCELSLSKYDGLASFEDCKYIAVKKDDKWGFVDTDDEYKLRPTDKVKWITDVKGDNFIFSDGDSYGVMNMDGEVVIRSKYESLSFVSDDILMAENDDDEYFLIDLKGDKVGSEKFKGYGYPHLTNGRIVAKTGKSEYSFIDKDGEIDKDAPEMYEYGMSVGDGSASTLKDNESDDDDY